MKCQLQILVQLGKVLRSTMHPVGQEECASNPDPATCTVDLEDRRFWRGALGPWVC